MPNQGDSLVAGLFSRDPVNASVTVADGYGLTIRVHRGHLVIEDGIGRHRRQRRYSRAERTLRRLVILGHTGYLTLEALRWCADVGVVMVHLDGDGRLLAVHGRPGTDDARLRRAQAAAAGSKVGVEIARQLLGAKLDGQAAVLRELLNTEAPATAVSELAEEVRDAHDLVRCRDLEAQASNTYFGAWSATVSCRFAERDRGNVPGHWLVFSARSSPLHRAGRTPRTAASPVNALLNYGYALAEAEARLAAQAVGLDPGLGIVHTDQRNRDSLALDLLEPLRPVVERYVLQLLAVRHFRASDFHETRQGACRLLPPLTHELAEQLPTLARAIAPHAEAVAHLLAHSSPGKIALRTPLSRQNNIGQQVRAKRSANRRELSHPTATPTCHTCGAPLSERRRQLCPACWPVTRAALASEAARQRSNKLAEQRRAGVDPSNTVQARARRSRSLSDRKREQLTWDASNSDSCTAALSFDRVLAALSDVPLSRLQEATGLSLSACSRIRAGQLRPHQRHWQALMDCTAPRPGLQLPGGGETPVGRERRC